MHSSGSFVVWQRYVGLTLALGYRYLGGKLLRRLDELCRRAWRPSAAPTVVSLHHEQLLPRIRPVPTRTIGPVPHRIPGESSLPKRLLGSVPQNPPATAIVSPQVDVLFMSASVISDCAAMHQEQEILQSWASSRSP